MAVLGVIAAVGQLRRNRAYVDEVAADVASAADGAAAGAVASLDTLLPRLDAVRDRGRESANRYRAHAPWAMRWGLYQGNSLGNAARDAYARELDGALLPQVAARIASGSSTTRASRRSCTSTSRRT